MLKQRTDLALEAKALWEQSAKEETKLEGVKAWDETVEGIPVSTVQILDETGAQSLGKPIGSYITLTLDDLARREKEAFSRSVRALAGALEGLLDLSSDAPALVVGLGNRFVTPDAVGPKAADHTLVTRHLLQSQPGDGAFFRPVAALAAGVLGTTGVESGELVHALAGAIRPACVIAIDALASRSLSRVGRTIQLADTGIIPGSGVGNRRMALNRETMGIPVIAIGVPTVVDAATLCVDILAEAGRGELDPQALHGAGESFFVTPRDIDVTVADMAKVIGYGVNLALQAGLSVEDVDTFLS